MSVEMLLLVNGMMIVTLAVHKQIETNEIVINDSFVASVAARIHCNYAIATLSCAQRN